MTSEKTADLIGGIVAITVCVIAYILTFRAKDPRHDTNYQNKSNSKLIKQFRRIFPSPYILAFSSGLAGLMAEGILRYYNWQRGSIFSEVLFVIAFGFFMLGYVIRRFVIRLPDDWDFYRVRPFFAVLGIILIIILIAAFFISGYEIAFDKH
jgi:hypothetical protein